MELQRSGQLWQRVSVPGPAGRGPWTILLVVLSCPPLFGLLPRFLGSQSMSFLQATPPSWLFSITPRERRWRRLPGQPGVRSSFTHREKHSVWLKHHGKHAAQLILGSDSWPCKTSLLPTVCSRHTWPHAAFPLSMALNLLLLPQPRMFSSFPELLPTLCLEPDVSSPTRLSLVHLVLCRHCHVIPGIKW